MRSLMKKLLLAQLLAITTNMALAQGTPKSVAKDDTRALTLNDSTAMYFEEFEDRDEDLQLVKEEYIFPSSLADGWHFTFNAGAFQSWGSYSGDAKFLNKTNYAAGLSVGKYISPVNDLRFQLLWGRHTGVFGDAMEKALGDKVPNWHFYSVSLAFQYLPNLTNLFCGYDEDRKFMLSALAGLSLEQTYNYHNGYNDLSKVLEEISVWSESPKAAAPRSLVGLQVGLLAECCLSKSWRLSFELTNTFLDDAFDGHITDQKWDGHFNALFGLTWHPRKNHNAALLQRRFNPTKYDELEEEIHRNRQVTIDAVANPNIVQKPVDVVKDVTYMLVSFDKNETNVPRLQQANIYTAATIWATYQAKNQKVLIFVTNNTKTDDKLFHERAWSICELLHRRWQIKNEDITVVADEDRIWSIQHLDCNKYVIVTINDKDYTLKKK